MKKLIILTIFISSIVSAQYKITDLSLKKPFPYTEEMQFKIVVKKIMNDYGSAFKYYNELQNGLFKFDVRNKDGYYLAILDNLGKVIYDIRLLKEYTNGNILRYKTEDISNAIDDSKIRYIQDNRLNVLSEPSVIIERNNIINDQIIISIPNYRDFKVFNRSFAEEHFYNPKTNDAVPLYELLEDAKILPYNGGEHQKFVSVDSKLHSIVSMDKDFDMVQVDDYLAKYYGSLGGGQKQFMNPTGIAHGRGGARGNYYTYPIYVADQHNNRIVRVNYVIDETGSENPYFDNNSFIEFTDDVLLPFDIEYCKATSSANDKVWASETYSNGSLVCVNMSGVNAYRIKGFRYTSDGGKSYHIINFSPGANMRMALYNDAFNCIAFTYSNNVANSICTFVLNENGEPENMYNDSIVNVISEHMNSDYQLTSIHIHNIVGYSELYPYMWVTSGGFDPPFPTSTSMVHGFAINKFGGFAYLASTALPRTSDWYFHNLLNMSMTDGYYDMLTIEEWSENYGVRHYYPFADIRSDEVTNYCNDSTDLVYWKGVFTNECWAKVWAKRKNKLNQWEDVEIKMIDGFYQAPGTYAPIIFRFKGATSLTGEDPIEIKLKLPMQDYVFGDSIKIFAKLFPDYNPPDNSENYTYREYPTYVKKTCLPRPGGCPFLYVKDENNDFIPDNNVLHRMEFSEPNVNITDRYKLRITPTVSNGAAELYLVENENDFAFIDQVKVYAVDYQSNKIMGITEDNKVVIYDSVSVIASDSVMLNNTNITSNVNYFNPSNILTNGYVNDSLFAHFSYPDKNNIQRMLRIKKNIQNSEIKSQSSSKEQRAKSIESSKSGLDVNLPIAFITNLRNLSYPNPTIKDTAGLLSATSIFSNTVSKIFARREMESVVILPLFNDTDKVDHLNIKWQSDFRMKYLGIANLNYSNYSMNEMPMIKGSSITVSTDSAITTALTSVDGNYGEVNSSALIKMTFDVTQLPSVPDGYKREYVIDVTGNYTNGNNNISSKIIQNIPLTYSLSQNYPNPFNPTTKINYELPKNNQVTLVIYDILGREVIKLVNNEFKQVGRYTVEFNGQNYASGVYFYRIETGDFVQSKKMVLIK